MNAKHRKTLKAIFAEPVSRTLEWRAIEALMVSLGCDVKEGKGSHLRVSRDGVNAYFSRPHPRKEAKPYQIRDAREFLSAIGETP